MKALITGAGTNPAFDVVSIGAATAQLFAASDWELILVDKAADGLERTLSLLPATSTPPISIQCDLTDVTQRASLLGRSSGGPDDIDVVAGVAGGTSIMPFLDQEFDRLHAEIELNLVAQLWLAHELLPSMVARGKGSVIFVGSDSAIVGAAGLAAYTAAKGGLMALTRTLAHEMGPHGIRVNCVSPGPTETPSRGPDVAKRTAAQFAVLPPLGRLGAPQDVAKLIFFLAGDDSSHITGQTVSVNGGLVTV